MKTKSILSFLKILSWVIFIELCLETGIILTNFIYSFFEPSLSKNFYLKIDFLELYQNHLNYYLILVSILIIVSALKAGVFYLILKIFKKINFEKPFRMEIVQQISIISLFALFIGIVSIAGKGFVHWMIQQKEIDISAMELASLFNGISEYLFLAAVIFVVAQLFKRGIELQNENELTV